MISNLVPSPAGNRYTNLSIFLRIKHFRII